jgi:hypothetical protein
MNTKLDTKIKWNQMLRNKIEKQNQLQKDINKKITIKKWLKLIQKQTKKAFNFWKDRRGIQGEKRKKYDEKRNSLSKSHRLSSTDTRPTIEKSSIGRS